METVSPQAAHAASLPHQKQLWLLVLLAALLLFPGLYGKGLAGYDDAFHAHEGREMIASGDWGSVRFNGNVTFDYLPMFCWMEASSFKFLGFNDSAAKFPSAVLGLATILLLYFLTLELTGQTWLSLLATMVLMSTQFFLKIATHAMTDVPFTFFFTLVIFFYLKGWKKPVYFTWMGLAAGLGMLTRSVIGVLALGVILLHLLVNRRYKSLFSPWLILGVLVAFSLPAAWLALQAHEHGPAALTSHLNFVTGKFSTGETSGRWATLLNYPVAMLKYYWPWLPFLLVGLFQAGRAALARRDAAGTLLIVWVLMVIVPLSIAGTRYPRYILPAFPAFSILSAMALDRWLPPSRRHLFFNLACAAGGLAIVFTVALPPKPRAADILALAPVADANCPTGERILFYTFEDGRNDFEWQYLWYGHRYTRMAPTLNALALQLAQATNATAIVDSSSYQRLLEMLPSPVTQRIKTLARSQNLVCFRLS